MTAKFVLLAVASLSLIACETTEHNDVAAKPARFVVRGAIVPDEAGPRPVKHSTKRVATKAGAGAMAPIADVAATAPAPAAVPLADPAPAVTPAPSPAPTEAAPSTSDSAAAGTSAPAVDAAPAVTPPPTDVPAVETATPTSAPEPTAVTPGWQLSDIVAMVRGAVGGLPIWMMALIGAVLLAAIGFGMSGGRKTDESESRQEPETV